MSTVIRYRRSDRRFLDPNLTTEFGRFLLKLFGAFCIGLILSPAIFYWAGGAQ